MNNLQENLTPDDKEKDQKKKIFLYCEALKNFFTDKKKLLIGTGVAIAMVLVAGGILAWQFWPVTPSPTPLPTPISDETAGWKVYRNEEYGFEIEYPKDWDYTVIESPNNPIVFAPKETVAEIKQSLENIESDKSLTLMFTVFDKMLFERGILPYRGKSTEYIQRNFSDIDVDGVKGSYYISEYMKDKFGYKSGERTVTVDLPIKDGYLSINLFDYQYLNILQQVLSTFRFID